MPEKAINEVFAARLKAARKALGLSQASVGGLMGLPEETSSARVNRWEKGVHPPSLESAELLADALGIPLPALVSRDDMLAELIAGYALLPKTQQQAILTSVQKALGAKQAEVVRAKLDQKTAQAKAPTKASKRRV
jgi:transcriptional regulator with XRE-family HTH domain